MRIPDFGKRFICLPVLLQVSVDEIMNHYLPELWKNGSEKLAQAELTAGQAEGLKTLRAMWKQDPAGQLERAGRLVGKWKDEYRVTQG